MWATPDEPILHNMEISGYPDGKAPVFPRCPICGETTDTFYRNADGEIVGCTECIYKSDAWETMGAE